MVFDPSKFIPDDKPFDPSRFISDSTNLGYGAPIESDVANIPEQILTLPKLAYRGIGKGAGNIAAGVRAVTEKISPESTGLIEGLKTFESAYPETLEGIGEPGKLQQAVAGMSEFGIPMIITALGGIPVGVAITFASLLGNTYNQYREQGIKKDRSFNTAFFNALAQTPIEMAGNLLQIGALKNLVKTFKIPGAIGKRVAAFGEALLKGVVGEGLEEYLQQYPDEIANYYAANPDVKPKDLAKYAIQNIKQIHERGVEAGEIGMISGGLLAGLGGAAGAIQTPFDIKDYRKIQDDLEAGNISTQAAENLKTGDPEHDEQINVIVEKHKQEDPYDLNFRRKKALGDLQEVKKEEIDKRVEKEVEDLFKPTEKTLEELNQLQINKLGTQGLPYEVGPPQKIPTPIRVIAPIGEITRPEGAPEIITEEPLKEEGPEPFDEAMQRIKGKAVLSKIKAGPRKTETPEITKKESKALEKLMVKVNAVHEETGEIVEMDQNAKQAIDDIDNQINYYEQMLECLAS